MKDCSASQVLPLFCYCAEVFRLEVKFPSCQVIFVYYIEVLLSKKCTVKELQLVSNTNQIILSVILHDRSAPKLFFCQDTDIHFYKMLEKKEIWFLKTG